MGLIKIKIGILSAIVLLVALIGFQNCSKVGFSGATSGASSKVDGLEDGSTGSGSGGTGDSGGTGSGTGGTGDSGGTGGGSGGTGDSGGTGGGSGGTGDSGGTGGTGGGSGGGSGGTGDGGGPTICNPLDPKTSADCSNGFGLKGYLYYLTNEQHGPIFSNDLRKARLSDYIQFGNKVENPVVMSQLNVTPRSWTDGFFTDSGQVVQTESGQKLMEWFSLDLYGRITLPEGTYQFAIVSDDGMLVEVNGQKILVDDGCHSPRWRCASAEVSFAANQKLPIHVQYFQGPRNEIAMQLMFRPSSQKALPCDATGGWMQIPAAAFSQ